MSQAHVPSFPAPKWAPSVIQPLDRLAARFAEVVKGGKDFVLFRHGTCAVVQPGLTEAVAHEAAKVILGRVVSAPPDVKPAPLPNGDILIRYNHPAANLVLDDVARANWLQIEARHLSALIPDEVLIMPGGPNKFDDFAKKVLFGRCFLYMDAAELEIERIVRAAA